MAGSPDLGSDKRDSSAWLPGPIRITEQSWPVGTKPVVSVHCLTYNHEPFIRDAIEGFLMQETSFPVEILIHDDASTDGTAGIIREYERQYPQLIKPIYQTENQYSQGAKPGAINLQRASGDFIAYCEGDDYWVSADKLELQVAHLNRCPRMLYCGTRAFVIKDWMKDPYMVSPSLDPKEVPDLDWRATIDGRFWMNTQTRVYRKDALQQCLSDTGTLYDSTTVHYLASVCERGEGCVGFIDRVTAVYRQHLGGVHTGMVPAARIQRWKRDLEIELAMFKSPDIRKLIRRKLVTAYASDFSNQKPGMRNAIRAWLRILVVSRFSPRLIWRAALVRYA